MVSNGLSSRRTTLKRPIVCKSKTTGDCGACELAVLVPPNPTGQDQVEPWTLDLQCDPAPTHLDFQVFVTGAFNPDLPLPPLIVGLPVKCFLRSPMQAGDFVVKFSLKNADGCIFVREALITVQ